ncbi:portal protein [Caudoviricetes sp.]|nr:portal protein [Caudoviricetes sp.]
MMQASNEEKAIEALAVLGGMSEDELLAMREKQEERLQNLAQVLIKKRDDAVAHRKGSGIEEEWAYAEDSYAGIDDVNRFEGQSGKPSGHDGGYVNGPPVSTLGRSTVLLNITRQYVDAAAARIGDMLLPTDDRNWSLDVTPLSDAVKREGLPLSEADAQTVQKLDEDRRKQAQGAQTQIEDWQIECQYHAEVRRMLDDVTRLGVGILKGPYPVKQRSQMAQRSDDGSMALVAVEKIVPASRCISPWDFFPDPACGDNIQNGSYVFERDTMTARQVRDLVGMEGAGYIDSALEKVLEEGPMSSTMLASGGRLDRKVVKDSDLFEVWYWFGQLSAEDMQAAGVECDGDFADAIITLINGHVVRASINPLDCGDFPYDVMPWSRKSGFWAGTGVAHQMKTPQRMLTASVRAMMDNAGLSSGPQIVIRKNAVTPADGSWTITPRKLWFVKPEADIDDVNKAFMSFGIASVQAELQGIIQMSLKMAEDTTGLPMLLQGQQGSAPDTVGGMILLSNNASSTLRRVARLFDDCVTEPHIRRYYNWLMIYADDEAIKGDFVIDARGSTALVERDLQQQAIFQMGQMVANPAFGIDPEKWFSEWLKSQRLSPKRFLMDEEKRQQLSQQPPPVAPQVQAAQIRAQEGVQRAQIAAEATLKRAQIDTDRDAVFSQYQQQRTQIDAELKKAEMDMRMRLALLEYANQEKITLQEAKVKLAEAAMKINLQRELSSDGSGPQVVNPIAEPEGRAPDGQAFQK